MKYIQNRLWVRIALCIQTDLRRYFEGAGRQTAFNLVCGSDGRVEIYAALGIASVLDRAIVYVMSQAVVIVTVNIGKD